MEFTGQRNINIAAQRTTVTCCHCQRVVALEKAGKHLSRFHPAIAAAIAKDMIDKIRHTQEVAEASGLPAKRGKVFAPSDLPKAA